MPEDNPQKPHINDEVKIAEREKHLAEANKAKAEQKKFEFELEQAKIQTAKKWYLRKSFLSQLAIVLTFITFLYEYIAKPAANRENIVAQTSIAYSRDSLRRAIERLDSSKRKLDTLRNILNKQQSILANQDYQIKQTRRQVDIKNRQADSITRLLLIANNNSDKTRNLYNSLKAVLRKNITTPANDIFKGQKLYDVSFTPTLNGVNDFSFSKYYITTLDGTIMPNVPTDLKGTIRLPEGQYLIVLINFNFQIVQGKFYFSLDQSSSGKNYIFNLSH